MSRQQNNAVALQDLSNSMVSFGSNVVKRNPVKSSLYLIGLLLCLFFNGFTVDEKIVKEYEDGIQDIIPLWENIDKAKIVAYEANQRYRNSQGWFWSCDEK